MRLTQVANFMLESSAARSQARRCAMEHLTWGMLVSHSTVSGFNGSSGRSGCLAARLA